MVVHSIIIISSIFYVIEAWKDAYWASCTIAFSEEKMEEKLAKSD